MPLVQLAGVEKGKSAGRPQGAGQGRCTGSAGARDGARQQGEPDPRLEFPGRWAAQDLVDRPGEMIEDGAQWRHGPRLFFRSDVDSFAAFHSIVFLPVFARMLVTTLAPGTGVRRDFFVLADETFIK